jgi:hypothetical protein
MIAKRGRGRPKGVAGRKRVLRAPKEEIITALEAKIDKQPNGCWVYQGTATRTGHTTFYYNGAIQGSAHRVAYEVWVGDIPARRYVLHRCENKMCVNPDHLYLATFTEVMKIRDEAGNSIRGRRNPKAKLTLAQVAEIRRRSTSGEALKPIADDFGVSRSTVSQIKHGNIWKED